MNRTVATLLAAAFAAALLVATGTVIAAPGDEAVKAQVPAAAPSVGMPAAARSASLPARGLFVRDQLSDAAKARLTELIIDALGMRVEVALLVPAGPWVIDGAGHTERDLTEARLGAVRRFLVERGVAPQRIFVEARTQLTLKEPRLDVQLVGQPAVD